MSHFLLLFYVKMSHNVTKTAPRNRHWRFATSNLWDTISYAPYPANTKLDTLKGVKLQFGIFRLRQQARF